MMYSNQMVCCLKAKGQVLREFKDTVYVPFGTEYSILLKNLNSVRAQVSITIDGQDVADGDTFIVNGNDSLEVSRFIKNGNLKRGNSFKFIERTGSVEQHRGVGIEDGLIRVQFQFEKPVPKKKSETDELKEALKGLERELGKKADKDTYPWRYYPPYYVPHYPYSPYTPWCSYSSVVGSAGLTQSNVGNAQNASVNYVSAEPMKGMIADTVITTTAAEVNDVGVTVAGGISNQQFVTVNSFSLEDTVHVMVLKVMGETEKGKVVKTPILVTQKPRCTSCGKQNKATAHFCDRCGTSLNII